MTVRMKALKSFFGNEGRVKAGREFVVATPQRSRDLELRGLAVVVAKPSGTAVVDGSDLPRIRNRAAEAGPLADQAGGETGGASALSSSHRVQAPGKRGSKQ